MFRHIRRKVVSGLSDRNLSAIRSRTRAVIRLANIAERTSAAANGARGTAGTAEWQAVTFGEHQLAVSMATAVPDSVSAQAIADDVVGPVLKDAVVVSQAPRDAILRALEGRLRGCCPGAPVTVRFGVVTFIQRFGSTLNAHLH